VRTDSLLPAPAPAPGPVHAPLATPKLAGWLAGWLAARDTKQRTHRFGEVLDVVIPTDGGGAGFIYAKFGSAQQASEARKGLAGRAFAAQTGGQTTRPLISVVCGGAGELSQRSGRPCASYPFSTQCQACVGVGDVRAVVCHFYPIEKFDGKEWVDISSSAI
jgi:hypothetical protein